MAETTKKATKKATKRKPGTGRNGMRPPGRPKGSKNKIPASIQEEVLRAFEAGGGYRWLVKQMEENPKAFMALLARIIPIQVTGKNGGPIDLEQITEIRIVPVKPQPLPKVIDVEAKEVVNS